MLIRDDLRRCVVFIGTHGDESNGGINCLGTAFLLEYETVRYLVTVQHIAVGLGDSPFLIRLNKSDGTADNVLVDPIEHNVRWFTNIDDPNVDLAIMPFNYLLQAAGYDCLFLHSKAFIGPVADRPLARVGIGDTTYTIGLFQLVAGKNRNLPVVHRGNIALMSGEEPVPVDDWLARGLGKVRHVDCYLVETQSLKGLSGSPVFARASADWEDFPVDGRHMPVRLSLRDVNLLGVWQGSWDSPPGTVLGVKDSYGARVPVGMGLVIPVEKMLCLLETDEMKNHRETVIKQRQAADVASLDSVEPTKPAPPSADEEPNHRERFRALLDAAVKRPGWRSGVGRN
jgi:hypothetical protein